VKKIVNFAGAFFYDAFINAKGYLPESKVAEDGIRYFESFFTPLTFNSNSSCSQ